MSIQSSIIGASGEYLVLSHLLRLGLIAGKTPDFTKDYDIVVLNESGEDSAPVQVKTSTNRNWMMSKKNEKIITNLVYCFVRFEGENKSEIFVMKSVDVSEFLKMSYKIWLKVPGRNQRPHKDTNMRKLDSDFKKHFQKTENLSKYLNEKELAFIESHKEGWLERYKFAWENIKI